MRSGHPGVGGPTVGAIHSEQMRRKPEDNPPHGRHQHKPVGDTLQSVALQLQTCTNFIVVSNVSAGGCRSSVAEHWLHKPDVLYLTPGDCWCFHFLYFYLIIPKFFPE